jgi:TolB-like protein
VLVPFAIGIVALIAIAGGSWYLFIASRSAAVATNSPAPVASNTVATHAPAAHLSVVVLPFTNLSGDPAQDYFADGITENLTTDLSRIRDSFVIARNTAFTFKGKSIDAKEIGKELGVRYVLEGSVQRDQNRVRVNAQLIDAETGAHLWADRFEEDIADLFKLQDQVVARLANALNYELIRADAETGARSKNPDAIDLDMRGNEASWRFTQQPTKDNALAIRALFEQALKIDPDDAQALAGDAVTYQFEQSLGWGNKETDYGAKIIGQADRAIAIAPDTLFAYTAKSQYLSHTGRVNEALRVADAQIAANSNYPSGYANRGQAEIYLGQFEKAKSDLQQPMRLSPRDPRMGWYHDLMANAELGLGHFDAAIEEDNKATDAGYKVFWPYLNFATAHVLKGEMDDAKTAVAEALRLNPKLSIKFLLELGLRAQLIDALRKAGLPEE